MICVVASFVGLLYLYHQGKAWAAWVFVFNIVLLFPYIATMRRKAMEARRLSKDED
jgi:hypothetical protein